MNDQEFSDMLDEKYKEIPSVFLNDCVNFLKSELSDETKTSIVELYNEKGSNWIDGHHFGWGMSIRNLLRENGFADDMLPDKNWDDYYIQVVECAIGVR